MNIAKKAFCRVFQMAFRLVLPVLPYREPKIIHSCADLGTVLDEKNIKSVLIITDKGIRSHGLTAPLESVLKENKVSFSIYDAVRPNPTVCNVEEALLCYHQNSCDCLIAIGGGSSMDCAKAVGARVAYPRKSVGQMKGILRVLRKLPWLIAIPTTAGTGSEVTLAAVITDDRIQHKYVEIRHLLELQQSFYHSGTTVPVDFRIQQLKKLYAAVKKSETEIEQALTADLGKSRYEGFMCEVDLVLSELSYMIRHTKGFAKRKTVHTPLAQFPSHSYKQYVPYGNVLIMSPWNYPFLLTMEPLADAIAAGNTAIVKPVAYSPATSKIIQKNHFRVFSSGIYCCRYRRPGRKQRLAGAEI